MWGDCGSQESGSVGPTTDCMPGLSKTGRDWKFPGEARDIRMWRHREGDTTAGRRAGRCVCVCAHREDTRLCRAAAQSGHFHE